MNRSTNLARYLAPAVEAEPEPADVARDLGELRVPGWGSLASPEDEAISIVLLGMGTYAGRQHLADAFLQLGTVHFGSF